jgi:hypothetical protein
MAASRFDRDEVYMLEGNRLQKLEAVAAALYGGIALSFDRRRDLANMINLILAEAIIKND